MTKEPEQMTTDELADDLRGIELQRAPRQRRRLILTVNGRTPSQLYRDAGRILRKAKL